jgi:formamidopyrimidine-DNA glycosylase
MPELPEVETIRGQLDKYLKGHRVAAVEVKNRKILSEGEKNLVGGKVTEVRRFGKVTVIDLSNDYSIVAHIKLTGQFIYRGPNLKAPEELSKKVFGGIPGKNTHVIFSLDRGGALYYNDVRRFGWIKVVKTKDVEEIPFIKKLGPEPFGKLTLDLFKQILPKSTRPIKIVLMDQEKLGGVGNIYANDALWLAKISPKRPANEIGEREAKILYSAILEVLKEGIKYGGASELAFVTPDGQEGEYQRHTLAYGRDGEPCERCHKAKFVKIFLGGRGTYFCPVCQRL